MRPFLLGLIPLLALAADPDGSVLFKTRCATCHLEQPDGRTPARPELARLAPELVINEMVNGKMKLQASGLSTDEMRALATYVTNKALTTNTTTTPGMCSGTPKPFAPGPGDWNGWGVEASNSRFQPRPGLTAADVPKLKLKWAFGFPGDTRVQGQPALVGGRAFVGSNSGVVYSLDAATGCTYWSYSAGGVVRTAISVERNGKGWIAFFGDGNGFAHGVDALTGKPIWKTRLDEHPLARVTGAPIYYKGRIIYPLASGEELGSQAPKYQCCTFRGSIVALNAADGKQVWKTYSIPDPPKVYKTTADGVPLWGPAGGGIWNSPTIDEKRKRLYVGTGNSYTGIDMPTTDAIIAIDLETGSMLWSKQVTAHDNWIPGCPKSPNCPENPGEDYDFAASPILRTINGKQVLVAGQKSGILWGLDPDKRGEILWQTRIGAGAAMIGSIGFGMAADGGTVFAAVGDIGRRDGTPGLYAVDALTGKKVWEAPAPANAGAPAQVAAVTAIPGVVFSGSWGGRLRAYNSATGAVVWEFNAVQDFETVNQVKAKGGAFNGGGPTISRGMVITPSGFGFAGGAPGNVLLAFSVDGK
jgi:polyvinyl alcohol dehydrogenase (cytochrome)